MLSAGINYCDTYFEFPELTKLQGEPNSESLCKLRNELKPMHSPCSTPISAMELMAILHFSSATPSMQALPPPTLRKTCSPRPTDHSSWHNCSNGNCHERSTSGRSSSISRSPRHRKSTHSTDRSGGRCSLPFISSRSDQQLSPRNCLQNPRPPPKRLWSCITTDSC
jgi:hypothetical protein